MEHNAHFNQEVTNTLQPHVPKLAYNVKAKICEISHLKKEKIQFSTENFTFVSYFRG